MFQVEPERVLYALGAPKDKSERRAGRLIRTRGSANKTKAEETEGENAGDVDKSSDGQTVPTSDGEQPDLKDKTPKETLQSLSAQAKSLLSSPSTSLTARRKQDLRAFQKSVKRCLSRPDAFTTMSLDTQLQEIIARMTPVASSSPNPSAPTEDTPQMSTASLQAEADSLNPLQLNALRDALKQARENPIDPSKPYATPWRPREFLSPFAFIPTYLEVHQKVCSAVYLRHPVARPGLGEVPTPFQSETLSLAHNWYLKRR